jgi:demethylmenaquinone methyltransferase/2-methoxy-6-polyprenyl-1,4-benzoquinol methylase
MLFWKLISMSISQEIRREKPEQIRSMFDAIAPTYDALNHLLSFGMDIRWRKKAIALLKEKKGGTFLDIAAGSGDISLEILSLNPQRIVGTDFALNMLNVFRQKLTHIDKADRIELVSCDAHELPFNDQSFDATIVAFGIRNFADRLRALREMHRVLKPNGISIVLELSTPQTPFIEQLYYLYSRIGIPLFGKIISRHNAAYRYLPDSIAQFPDQQEFLSLLQQAGFHNANSYALTFGAATIYMGRK